MAIEKIDFYYLKQEQRPFTTHYNSVLQNLRDWQALGLWSYLSSLPPLWSVNKKHLMGHFGIGRDRLDKAINYLKKNKLIIIERERLANGQLGKGYILVKNGDDFLKDLAFEDAQASAQSCANNQATEIQDVACATENTLENNNLDLRNLSPEKPSPGFPSPGKPTAIKEINNKLNKKQKNNISYASDDAQPQEDYSPGFILFWEIHPRKKDKKRAYAIWKKKKLEHKTALICKDLENRKQNDHQWQNIQFVPHPTTHLNNEGWNNDITPISTGRKRGGNTSFSDFMNSDKNSGVTYDEHGNPANPFN